MPFLKFSFSEKATKTCANVLMYGFEIHLVNVKTMTTIAKISMAFSEKLNFRKIYYWAISLVNLATGESDTNEGYVADSST